MPSGTSDSATESLIGASSDPAPPIPVSVPLPCSPTPTAASPAQLVAAEWPPCSKPAFISQTEPWRPSISSPASLRRAHAPLRPALERRRREAGFRDPNRTLDNYDFGFNPKRTAASFSISHRLFHRTARRRPLPRPRWPGKSHLARRSETPRFSGLSRALPRDSHPVSTNSHAVLDGTRKQYMELITTVAAAHHRRFRHAQAAQTAARICWRSCAPL